MRKFEIYLDGAFFKTDEDILDILKPGNLNAKGVFETIRIAGCGIEYFDEHLERLMKGLKTLKIKHSYTPSKLKAIVHHVVGQNALIKIGRLRIMVFQENTGTHCFVMALPYHMPRQQTLSSKFIKTDRLANSLNADVKSLDYGLFAGALKEAQTEGCDDVLLLNRKGHVFESSRANVFIILKNEIITPPLASGCLNGIIRQKFLKYAKASDLCVREINITPLMVQNAQAIFLTNSLMGIMKTHFPPCPTASKRV